MEMNRAYWLLLLLGLTLFAVAQQDDQNQAPPRSGSAPGESSSKSTKIDLSPPPNDTKDHPESGTAVSEAEDANGGDVQEMHPWDPHKAMKDLEVGDFYFKRKNYRAALDRYQEALLYKPNDALSNFQIGQCLEKMKRPEEARLHYEAYLKILPQGPLSAEAHKALDRLKVSETSQK
jgi:tetratricopeptide (TPR) repeat protein